MPQNCPHVAGPPLNCEGNSACTFLLADRERRACLPELEEHTFCPRTLCRHSWLEPSLLRTCWGFGLWNARGWVPAASQASRKPWGGGSGAGGESTVMEAQSPQDPLRLQLWGFVASSSHWPELISSGTSGSRRCWRRWGKVGRRFLCVADCWGCLFSEDSGEEGLDVESQLFVPGVDRAQCSLVCGVQFSQHRLLRGLFFPHCFWLHSMK